MAHDYKHILVETRTNRSSYTTNYLNKKKKTFDTKSLPTSIRKGNEWTKRTAGLQEHALY